MPSLLLYKKITLHAKKPRMSRAYESRVQGVHRTQTPEDALSSYPQLVVVIHLVCYLGQILVKTLVLVFT